jgi:molybdopterin-containing oxidoreductase family membrane subunit
MFSFIISIVVNIGMWFERFVIIVTSLHRDYFHHLGQCFHQHLLILNFHWNNWFLFCFLLYARTFPVIAQAEVKTLKATGEIL